MSDGERQHLRRRSCNRYWLRGYRGTSLFSRPFPVYSHTLWHRGHWNNSLLILRQTVWKSTEILEENICKRLKKAGFQFEKKEGNLFVVKNENRFQVQLADTYNRRIKHLYVYFKFTDENSNKINVDGWSRASNIINVRNTETIFVTLEDHFCCCYQTAIGNSKDFMKEFNFAYDVIGDAMDDYNKLFPLLERDYPNNVGNQTSIGFK